MNEKSNNIMVGTYIAASFISVPDWCELNSNVRPQFYCILHTFSKSCWLILLKCCFCISKHFCLDHLVFQYYILLNVIRTTFCKCGCCTLQWIRWRIVIYKHHLQHFASDQTANSVLCITNINKLILHIIYNTLTDLLIDVVNDGAIYNNEHICMIQTPNLYLTLLALTSQGIFFHKTHAYFA